METHITLTDAVPADEGPSRQRHFGVAASPWPIHVLTGTARRFAEHCPSGSFSLKSMAGGAALYRTGAARHHLAGDAAMLLNAGQPYDVEFAGHGVSRSFCLFYADELARETWAALQIGSAAAGLGETAPSAGTREVPTMVFRPDAAMAGTLAALRLQTTMARPNPAAIEATAIDLLAICLRAGREHQGLAARVPAAKSSTRRAVLQRLDRARRCLDDAPFAPPNLDQLARACGMSKFHLLRLFRAVYGSTPSAYAEARRIDRAVPWLMHGDLAIGEIAHRLGYESQSAFTRAFRRHNKMSPTAFRKSSR